MIYVDEIYTKHPDPGWYVVHRSRTGLLAAFGFRTREGALDFGYEVNAFVYEAAAVRTWPGRTALLRASDR